MYHVELWGYRAPEGLMRTQSRVDVGTPECAQIQLVLYGPAGPFSGRLAVDVTAMANADPHNLVNLVKMVERFVNEANAEGRLKLQEEFRALLGNTQDDF